MKMDREHCPFCGSEREILSDTEAPSFVCGTLDNDPYPRTRVCWRETWERQKEELAKLRAVAEIAEHVYKNSRFQPDLINKLIKPLKEAGYLE